MTTQDALFETEADAKAREEVDRNAAWVDYLKSLTACPFCGRSESTAFLYVNNHLSPYNLQQYADGAGCHRLHLLGNQTRYMAQRGDPHYLDRYAEIVAHQSAATHWPTEWLAALDDDLVELGVFTA